MNFYDDCVTAMRDLTSFTEEQSKTLVSFVNVRKPITIYVAAPLDDFTYDIRVSWNCIWDDNITTYVEYFDSPNDIAKLTKSIKKTIVDFVFAVKNGDPSIPYTKTLVEATKEIKQELFWLFGDIT